jgi:hypothetical protein
LLSLISLLALLPLLFLARDRKPDPLQQRGEGIAGAGAERRDGQSGEHHNEAGAVEKFRGFHVVTPLKAKRRPSGEWRMSAPKRGIIFLHAVA